MSAVDALRDYADDLLDSGDARLTLERAFRWGYHDEAGNEIAGLQEQVQDLRHQRERLLRHIGHPDFLESLAPELDRLDALDHTDQVAEPAQEDDATAFDRLLDRLEHGYESDEAQADLDQLSSALAASIGERSAAPQERGGGQPSSGAGQMRDAHSARVDQLRQMLFEGGAVAEPGASPAGWRRADPQDPDALAGAGADLALIAEIDRIEVALARLQAIGSVHALDDEDLAALAKAGDDELHAWLAGWRDAAVAILPAGTGAGVSVSLPPEVVTAISRDLLRGLFQQVASPVVGEHHSHVTGTAGDPAETTVAWEPGRPLDLDLVATVAGAVRRGGIRPGGGVSLQPDDFAVVERGSAVSVATVLAIDRSRSMGQSGGWTSARKVALAMHELIRQSYRRDSLGLVAFSSDAEQVDIADVPQMQWDRFEHGTHLQAALALSRRMLRRVRAGTRQIVVITDGEPTLATIRGEQVFASPPTSEVLDATMTEVVRCTREGITINVVILGRDTRNAFAEQIARVNRGRVFTATSETLGSYLLRDYVTR